MIEHMKSVSEEELISEFHGQSALASRVHVTILVAQKLHSDPRPYPMKHHISADWEKCESRASSSQLSVLSVRQVHKESAV